MQFIAKNNVMAITFFIVTIVRLHLINNKLRKAMKNLVYLLLALIILASSCGPRPMYKTHEGKKKLDHYNSIQFGARN